MKTKPNEMNELEMIKGEPHEAENFVYSETVKMETSLKMRLLKKFKAVIPMISVALLSVPTQILADEPGIDVEAFKELISSWISPITTILLFAIPLVTLVAALVLVVKYQLGTERKKEEMEIETKLFKTVAIGALGMSISVILKIVGM